MISNSNSVALFLLLFLVQVIPIEALVGRANMLARQRTSPLPFVHEKLTEDLKQYLHWEEPEKQPGPSFTLPEDSACYDPGKQLDLLFEEHQELSRNVVDGDPFAEFHGNILPPSSPVSNYWKETPSQKKVMSHRSGKTVPAREMLPKKRLSTAYSNYLLKPGHWRLAGVDSPLAEEGQRHEVVHWDPCPLLDDDSSQA